MEAGDIGWALDLIAEFYQVGTNALLLQHEIEGSAMTHRRYKNKRRFDERC